jgi:hypothetical protein
MRCCFASSYVFFRISEVGPLTATRIQILGAEVTGEDNFSGKRAFTGDAKLLLKRSSPKASIHATITGKVKAGQIQSQSVLFEPAAPIVKGTWAADAGMLSLASLQIPAELSRDRIVEIFVNYRTMLEQSGDPCRRLSIKVDGAEEWSRTDGQMKGPGHMDSLSHRFQRAVKAGQTIQVQASVSNYRTRIVDLADRFVSACATAKRPLSLGIRCFLGQFLFSQST